MEKQTVVNKEKNMHEEMRRAFALLSGKWKLEIMWLLNQRVYRFGELRKAIPGITQHMLTEQLRDLAANGVVIRTAFAEIPPRVEYELAQAGIDLLPAFGVLCDWSLKYEHQLAAP